MGLPARIATKLRDELGAEAGGDLVTWLEEMRAEHADTRADFAALRAEFASLRAEFATFRQEVAAMIAASELRLTERIGRVELRVAEVKADLMKWMLVFWVGAVGAIAALAGVLRH